MATLFSKIIAGEIPSYKIAEDERFFAFLDIHPMAKGHTLVVPKKEVDYLFDLEDDLLGDMMIFAKQVAASIEECIPCLRVGVMVLGLEVPHAHIHLIPIEKEGDMNLSNPKLSLSEDEFREISQKIHAAFVRRNT